MYVMACTMVILVTIYQFLRAFIGASDVRSLHKQMHGPMWLYLIPVFFMPAPFFASMWDEMQLIRGQPLAISAGIISVALTLFGALVVLVATVVDGIRHRTERGFGFSGRRLVLAASASLALVAATSHLIFTRDAGTVTFEFFRDEVKDMHCEIGRILIQWNHSPAPPCAIAARAGICSIAMPACRSCLGRITAKYSADLAVALHEMLENAKKQ